MPGDLTGLIDSYLDKKPPGLESRVFAPGIVSTADAFEFNCTFSTDGKEFYFTRRKKGENNQILVSRWDKDGWTMPEPAFFSGEYGGHELHISPGDEYLYFGTRRPHTNGAELIYSIWELSHSADGWSDPAYHSPGLFVSVISSRNIYITNFGNPTGIGRKIWKDGRYCPIEMLGNTINSPAPGIHPCIACLIFQIQLSLVLCISRCLSNME